MARIPLVHSHNFSLKHKSEISSWNSVEKNHLNHFSKRKYYWIFSRILVGHSSSDEHTVQLWNVLVWVRKSQVPRSSCTWHYRQLSGWCIYSLSFIHWNDTWSFGSSWGSPFILFWYKAEEEFKSVKFHIIFKISVTPMNCVSIQLPKDTELQSLASIHSFGFWL